MTTLLARPCSTLGCPDVAAHHGKCPVHQRVYERSRGSSSARGYGGDWKTRRLRILRRDPICRDESGCNAPSTDVDHILSRRNGGTDDDSNLRGLCKHHNNRKSALFEGAMGQRN